MPSGTTSWPASASAVATVRAEVTDTRCSTLRPPNTSPTRAISVSLCRLLVPDVPRGHPHRPSATAIPAPRSGPRVARPRHGRGGQNRPQASTRRGGPPAARSIRRPPPVESAYGQTSAGGGGRGGDRAVGGDPPRRPGLRGGGGRGRRARAAAGPRRRLRPGGARSHAAGDRRPGGLPPVARRRALHAHPHAHRPLRRARPRGRPRDRRRRLSHQAVLHPRAGRPGQGDLPPRRGAGQQRRRRGAGPGDGRRAERRSGQAQGDPRRRRGAPDGARVRPAALLRLPPRPRVHPRRAARAGVGLRLRGLRAHRQLPHQPAARQARARSVEPGLGAHRVGRRLPLLRAGRVPGAGGGGTARRRDGTTRSGTAVPSTRGWPWCWRRCSPWSAPPGSPPRG